MAEVGGTGLRFHWLHPVLLAVAVFGLVSRDWVIVAMSCSFMASFAVTDRRPMTLAVKVVWALSIVATVVALVLIVDRYL